jgi:hypothetical protein
VAAAIAPASWNGGVGFRGKSVCSGFGGWIQQHKRIYIDVPEAIGDDTKALFEEWKRGRPQPGKADQDNPLNYPGPDNRHFTFRSLPHEVPPWERRHHNGKEAPGEIGGSARSKQQLVALT